MKKLPQSVIDDARRHVEEVAVRTRRHLVRDSAALPERIAAEAEAVERYKPLLETVTKTFNDAQAQGRLDELLESEFSDSNDFVAHDLFLEIVARALERCELPPKPFCDYAARVLRQAIKKKKRGNLRYRNICIINLLIDLEGWGFPLFPNPEVGSRPGQIYGGDMIAKEFKKAGINRVSVYTVDRVWRAWKRRWGGGTARRTGPPTIIIRT